MQPSTSTTNDTRADHYRTQADAAQVTALRALLAECRAALPADFYDLACRVDDAIGGPVQGEPVLGSLGDGLVFESYGAGFGWFRS